MVGLDLLQLQSNQGAWQLETSVKQLESTRLTRMTCSNQAGDLM